MRMISVRMSSINGSKETTLAKKKENNSIKDIALVNTANTLSSLICNYVMQYNMKLLEKYDNLCLSKRNILYIFYWIELVLGHAFKALFNWAEGGGLTNGRTNKDKKDKLK